MSVDASANNPPLRPISITLLGCGKMGSAMLRLWLEQNLVSHAHVIKPSPLSEPFASAPNVSHSSGHDGKTPIDSDVFMIAVKPQMINEAISPVVPYISKESCILSVAAGKELDTLSSYFGGRQPIIRAMPNTPSAVGKGVSAAISNNVVSNEQHEKIDQLLKALGALYWIEDEPLMNAIAALSGSGPAYVYYMIEVLSKAGCSIGIPEQMSIDLARQTVVGSAALAERDSNIPASILRENVTSPGGSTLEALKILMDGRLEKIFDCALEAAKKRGEELNS